MMRTETVPETLVEEFARFACSLSLERIPAKVVEKAKRCLLHNLACGAAGYEWVEEARAIATCDGLTSGRGATLWVEGTRLPAKEAAFANAAATHARAQDDEHYRSRMHLGTLLVPSAIALAERQHCGGSTLITSLVVGYEVGACAGQPFADQTARRGFRTTTVYGILAVAATSAKLLGLDERQTAHAIGLAANLASGLGQCWIDGSTEWRMHAGLVARNGILAAEMAAHGATAARTTLEGQLGFFHAYAGVDEGVRELTTGLGSTWEIEQVIFKPHPVCSFTMTPAAVACRMAQDLGLSPESIASVKVRLTPAEAFFPGIDKRGPFSGIGATVVSAQFCVAVALRDRAIRMTALHEFDDPVLLRLVEATTVERDPKLGPLTCEIEIALRDGTVHVARSEPEDSRYNWDWSAAASMARSLFSESPLPAGSCDRLLDAIVGLESESTVAPLIEPLVL